MARIRSIHPGQPTDEDFMEMSFEARLFALHLRCEADDNGVFEWKPKQLKARIFPGDNVDGEALLNELAANNQCMKFEVNGKQYGAIRNFRKYQRPQKPKGIHPLPDQVRAYVALSDTDTGQVSDQYNTDTGNGIQVEDGGGVRLDEGGNLPLEGMAPKRQPKPKSKRTRIPKNFPSEKEIVWAEEVEHVPREIAEREAKKFRNDAEAKGKTFVLWHRAWENWITGGIEKGWISFEQPNNRTQNGTSTSSGRSRGLETAFRGLAQSGIARDQSGEL